MLGIYLSKNLYFYFSFSRIRWLKNGQILSVPYMATYGNHCDIYVSAVKILIIHLKNKRQFIAYKLDISFQNHLLQNMYNIIRLFQEKKPPILT